MQTFVDICFAFVMIQLVVLMCIDKIDNLLILFMDKLNRTTSLLILLPFIISDLVMTVYLFATFH